MTAKFSGAQLAQLRSASLTLRSPREVAIVLSLPAKPAFRAPAKSQCSPQMPRKVLEATAVRVAGALLPSSNPKRSLHHRRHSTFPTVRHLRMKNRNRPRSCASWTKRRVVKENGCTVTLKAFPPLSTSGNQMLPRALSYSAW